MQWPNPPHDHLGCFASGTSDLFSSESVVLVWIHRGYFWCGYVLQPNILVVEKLILHPTDCIQNSFLPAVMEGLLSRLKVESKAWTNERQVWANWAVAVADNVICTLVGGFMESWLCLAVCLCMRKQDSFVLM
jgi:hypothetical protein